jgi:DNA mismatch repair protein MutL
MGIIQRLDEQLSNMIAAGEVIERPMAVVKELVENALDAKAHFIEVRINQGGIESIDVLDDGIGMDPSDAQLAFERHTTSKITNKEQLFAPEFLGFRGEALPSIASVSDCVLKTSKDDVGTYVHIAYGKLMQVRPHSASTGTHIHIEGLFRKTPARFKHLKSANYEASLIIDLMEKFALSRPDVAFKLIDETKVLLNTSGTNQMLEVLANSFGNRIARLAHEFTLKDYDFIVQGVWVDPQEHRSNNKGILIFINNRIVRSWYLQKAIVEAFSAYIPAHRYPVCIVNLKMDAHLVDVNVHPSKWEVRLSKEQQAYFLLLDGISKQLSLMVHPKEHIEKIEEPHKEQTQLFNVNHYVTHQEDKQSIQLEIKEETIETKKDRHPTFPTLDLIGQMHGRYILASSENDLYVIDQHAAKERINYELILKQINENQDQFDLLLPIEIECSSGFMERLNDFKLILDKLHLHIEPFSLTSYIVRSIPLWLNQNDLVHFMQDVMDRFLVESKINQEVLRESVIATMACHRSIRFNQSLTVHEMRHIIEELSYCAQPYHCPHGRPTLVKQNAQSLWKDFER